MRLITTDRGAAALLVAAALLALLLAATPAGPVLLAVRGLEPFAVPGLHLTIEHLISDGLLAVFFLLVAIELRHELTRGDLATPAAAAIPAAAALGGVAVPAGIYLLLAGGGAAGGWPIPTATDIAFALGLLALLGRGLPNRVRAFLLALAILDDLVAIVLIAVVFPAGLQPLLLLPAAALLGAFLLVARRRTRFRTARVALLWVVAVAVWYLVALSGVHPTIAGVALGLVLPPGPAATADRLLQPVSRGLILPLFAFTAGLVRLEDVSLPSSVLTAIAVALPIGKPIGIVAGGLLATAVLRRGGGERLNAAELQVVGVVGGVGFTVSLLMARLAFPAGDDGAAGVLGVLIGSGAAIALSCAVVPPIAARARRRTPPRPDDAHR